MRVGQKPRGNLCPCSARRLACVFSVGLTALAVWCGVIVWRMRPSAPPSEAAARRDEGTAPGRPLAETGPPAAAVAEPQRRTKWLEDYGRLPLSFEPQSQQADGRARFLARGDGYALAVTAAETLLVLRRPAPHPEPKSETPYAKPAARPEVPAPPHAALLRMRLIGAAANAELQGIDELPGKTNYLVGSAASRWRIGVLNYARVRCRGVYPGIDVVHYGNQRRLEYDFVVAPGGDPSAIALEIETRNPESDTGLRGAGGAPFRAAVATIDAEGGLLVRTGAGEVRFNKPRIYQPGPDGEHPVTGRFVRKDKQTVGFQVGVYDRTRPLVIDPVLSYSTYLGGTGYDYANSIAVDSSGNAYVTGFTYGLDFPSVGALQTANHGAPDAFVAKLNAAGTALVYSTYLGGSGEDYGLRVRVDEAGSAYVAGYTNSADFPTASALQASNAGGYDAFVAKLNASGSALDYSTYLGGSGSDYAYGLAVDAAGAAYLAGFTSSTNFPVSTGAAQAAYNGGAYEAFAAKIAASGSSLSYATFLGGEGEDYAAGVAVDSSQATYITGYTNSSSFPTANAYQAALGGGTCGSAPCFDAFVTKLNPAGSAFSYSTYLGGNGGDYGYDLAVDSAGSAYVTGYTTSASFPVTNGVVQRTFGGSYDAYVAKLNAAGSGLAYSTYLGGINAEIAYGIAVDSAGTALITGYTSSSNFPLASPVQAASGGLYDAFVCKLSGSGSTLLFSSYLGGSLYDYGRGAAVDSARNAYVAGGTFSTDFPTTAGALQRVYGDGAYDAFLAKFVDLGTPVARLSASSLDFLLQRVGASSAARTLTLTNNGDAPLVIQAVGASGDFSQTHDCGSELGAGQSCTISVIFTPSSVGACGGFLTVSDNAAGSPRVVTLSGTGAAPVVSLAPASLVFPDQTIDTGSSAQPVTLENTGNIPLQIASLSMSGDFLQTNNCGTELAAGSSCVTNVQFVPAELGERTGALTLIDDAAGSPHTVTLSGAGIRPDVELLPASITFPSQMLFTTSSARTVTLVNNSASEVKISWIESSDYFWQTNNCGNSVPGGSTCTIEVTFLPEEEGMAEGIIYVLDSAPGSPHTVLLSGTGFAAATGVESLTIEPGELTARSAGTGTVTLNGIAASAAVVVNLSSNSTALEVPASVTVPVDSRSATFAVSAGPVSTPALPTVTASFGSSVRTASVNLVPRAPVATKLTPPKSNLSPSALVLTVEGDDFSTTSVVRWNGADRPTQFVSLNQLTAQIGAADLASPGVRQVTVYTPSPGGGLSATLDFKVGPTENDFNGDGKTDFAVWHPATQSWLVTVSGLAPATLTRQLGTATDVFVPADYDGDGKTDFAIWRPRGGWWYIVSSATGAVNKFAWGRESDIPVPGDYDGDGAADAAFWRPSTRQWYIQPATNSSEFFTQEWGETGDIPVVGDFDGDGKTDLAVWRPGSGAWHIIPSSDPGTPLTIPWGETGDVPCPGDYDGDGKTDAAVWRRADGTWYVRPSRTPETSVTQVLGGASDLPLPGDYDGDGRADFAVRSRQTGEWTVVNSSDGATRSQVAGDESDRPATLAASTLPMLWPISGANFDGGREANVAVWRAASGAWIFVPGGSLEPIVWGASGDKPVPGDYDGDGTADVAYWRPATGQWYVRSSSDPEHPLEMAGGTTGDVPLSADYDGDGKTDPAFWRPSTGNWYVRSSVPPGAFVEQAEGASGDIPAPADYDGDGKADLALWRPAEGLWYIQLNGDVSASQIVSAGVSGDVPVPGDYDGDGKADVAFFRPAEDRWVVIPSSSPGTQIEKLLGMSGDTPVPKDYDGDGRTDFAVYRPENGTSYIIMSASPWTVAEIPCGAPGDVPVNKPPAI